MSEQRAAPDWRPAGVRAGLQLPVPWRIEWARGLLHLLLLAVLVAEAEFLRQRFDTDRFLGASGAIESFLLALRHAAPIGISALGALALIGWSRLASEYDWLRSQPQRPGRSALSVLLHLALLAFVLRLSQVLFGSELSEEPRLGILTVLWGLGVVALPLSAASAAFRTAALLSSARRLLPVAGAALAIGVTVFALGQQTLDGGLWYPLQVATFQVARVLLGLMGGTAGADLTQFELQCGEFRVLVTHHCGGSEGIALVTTFLTAYLIWFRQRLRFPQVLLLLPVGVLLIWVANAFRLALLVWIGGRFSPRLAMEGFHSYAGLIAFCGVTLSTVYATRRIAWFSSSESTADRPADTVNPAVIYLAPFLAVLATSLVAGAFTSGPALSYPLRVVVALVVLGLVRRELPRPRWDVHWTALLYGTIAFLIWAGLEWFGPERPLVTEPVAGAASLGPWMRPVWFALRAAGFLLIAPLVEELAFRGFLARRLVRADFETLAYRAVTPLAWCLSALAFGLLHGRWVAATAAGALFGLATMHRGRLADGIVAHAATNLLIVLFTPLLGLRPWWH